MAGDSATKVVLAVVLIMACRAADGTCDRANLHNNDNCICPNSCKIMTNTIGEVPNNLGCGLDDFLPLTGSCNGEGGFFLLWFLEDYWSSKLHWRRMYW
jgi:hypothetical protein